MNIVLPPNNYRGTLPSFYVPFPTKDGMPPFDPASGLTIPGEWLTVKVTVYRPNDTNDEAGARVSGDPSTWTVLFPDMACAMILESALEANPEDESHQVLEQVARYVFFTNTPVTVGDSAVRDSDIIGIGPIGAPTRKLTLKSWEQWPEMNPTMFKLHAQEIRA